MLRKAALHLTAQYEHVDVLQKLLRNGSQKCHKRFARNTYLLKEVTLMFLNAVAHNTLNTPLHLAVQYDCKLINTEWGQPICLQQRRKLPFK